MTPRRSKITLLGGIFFSIIIIGSAISGKPELLISILATALILYFLHYLLKKMPAKQEVTAPTEDETQYVIAQQQSHIQLLAIFIPLTFIGAAINGDPLILKITIAILLIFFTFFTLKKRSAEQRAIYVHEKKILFKSVVIGFIAAAAIIYFDLAK